MVTNLAAVVGCFLVGGIPVGLLIARACGIDDIRKYGSGNIGASNVLRTVGARPALVVWLVDIAKGALPTLVAATLLQLGGWWYASAAFATILGHCFSPYLRFAGGRGVATSLGVLLALDWRVGVLALSIWIVLTFVTRYISLSSILAALSATPLYWLFSGTADIELLVCILTMGLLIAVRHAPNIGRLLSGTETKVGQKAKELQEDAEDEQQADES